MNSKERSALLDERTKLLYRLHNIADERDYLLKEGRQLQARVKAIELKVWGPAAWTGKRHE